MNTGQETSDTKDEFVSGYDNEAEEVIIGDDKQSLSHASPASGG